MRGTLKEIEVERWGGEQAHRWVGSLKPRQDLSKYKRALWTRLRPRFFSFHEVPAPNIRIKVGHNIRMSSFCDLFVEIAGWA